MPFAHEQVAPAPPVSRPLDPADENPAGGPPDRPVEPYPKTLIKLTDDKRNTLLNWLDLWLNSMSSSHGEKMGQYETIEKAYRALPEAEKSTPFVGANNDTMPVIAMAVDPAYSRIETGIFQQDPIFRAVPLKKSMQKYAKPLEKFIDFYVRNKLSLRQESAPRILEATKLGCCVFKTIFDREEFTVMGYDSQYNETPKKVRRFDGPRILGISRDQFMYPAGYKNLQECPIVAELQYPTVGDLHRQAESNKLDKDAVDRVKAYVSTQLPPLQFARETAAQMHQDTTIPIKVELVEFWFDYDINDDGLPESMVCTYHRPSREILQLRYNWYFHQRKPYTLIPYTVTNGSLDGVGLGEMALPMQKMITKWQQMASDNAYLANIRMFAVKTGSNIEDKPRLYSGRMFELEDPSRDIKPLQLGDIYNSTISERQNLFGMVEKRTGISDYLTGRESPILGSRATATATTALIQEGTKRVEQVLENFREGYAEMLQNCVYIWIQYGAGDLADLVFGDDETGHLVTEFFDTMKAENVNGSLAFELSITDANTNKQAMLQMQLALIQQVTAYYEKLIQGGQMAMQAAQQAPPLADLIVKVMDASRKLYMDLMASYPNITNPEDYLPSLDILLSAIGQPPSPASPPPAAGGPPGNPANPGAGAGGGLPPELAALMAGGSQNGAR